MAILKKLTSPKRPISLSQLDPRYYQTTVLAGLLAYGLVCLKFDVRVTDVAVTIATALACQWVATKLWGLPHYDPKSALISGLSLCLLLRSNDPMLYALAAGVAIFSKFVLRWGGKHVFNPTNFALVVMWEVCGRGVWISPGQWGHDAILAFLIACLGSFVVNRACRSDVTWAFIGFYLAMVFGRSLWLGDPWAIPLHMVSNGGLILFAFYMISDPKTTPVSRAGRILFALMVAVVASLLRFGLYDPRGLYLALFLISLLTPFLDKLLPMEKHENVRAVQTLPAGAVVYDPTLAGEVHHGSNSTGSNFSEEALTC